MKALAGILLLSSLLLTVNANAMSKLLRDLFKSYDKNVLPKDGKSPVMIRFGIQRIGISGVDRTSGILSTHMWIRMNWKIPALSWDPKAYDDIEDIKVPSSRIWLPDIFLLNSARGDGSVMSDSNVLAVISSDGDVSLDVPKSLNSWCDLNGFNLDPRTVNCTLTFSSWVHNGWDIDYSSTWIMAGDAMGLLVIRKTSAERVKKLYSCCPAPYVSVKVLLEIFRRY